MSQTVSKTEGKNLRVVLYEGAGSRVLDSEARFETISALLDAGFEVTRPASGDEVARADASTLLVLGQFGDGKGNDGNGNGSPEGNGSPPARAEGLDEKVEIRFRDISDLSPEAILGAAAEVQTEVGARRLDEWKPWFPVIDYDRCTNCMQCLSFCLFDVYSVDENEQIKVQKESNCKTDCPACSRVCPEVAILFPKYKKGPINGDQVREEDIQREAMKVDVSALLGGDIYSSLKSRQSEARKRFSTERDESRALIERKKCLKKLQGALDIPDEVLMTLPSAGDIEERAERAKEKMKKRMERSQTVQDSRQVATEEEWGI